LEIECSLAPYKITATTPLTDRKPELRQGEQSETVDTGTQAWWVR
jgi:hypothetical protein